MDLDNLIIPQGYLAIDPDYGISLITNYLFELQQIKAGVPFKELGIGERRAATNVQVIHLPIGNDFGVTEVVSQNKSNSRDKIAVLNISGMIQAQDGMSSIGMATMADQLLKEKNNVVGALVKINSGGGYTDGAEIMSAALKEFGKPTVTVSNFAGSAAYMIASHTNEILALSDMSSFGSIGVMYELNKSFRDKYVQLIESVYSEDSPAKNDEWRKWLLGDSSGFQKLATQKDGMFMNTVRTNRKLEPGDLTKETLLGGMFHAKEAKKRGLIDGIGDNSRAFSIIQKLIK